MRMRVGVLVAMLVAGCHGDDGTYDYCADGQPDPDEECQPTAIPYCRDDCKLPIVGVTVRWSFETLYGDLKAPCLPGDPPVTVQYGSPYEDVPPETVPCAVGEVQQRVKARTRVGVSSTTDHEHSAEVIEVPGMDAVLTAIIYADAGWVDLQWRVDDVMGNESSCEREALGTVRVILDGVDADQVLCYNWGRQGTRIGPLASGTHTVRAEVRDDLGNVKAMSAPVDVTVLAGATVTAGLLLEP